jgi:diadenosine tetraphosphate (Ap4A) HIT family hydrolase|tara:strand:- start:404 stop:826 length:423 start_codon:yes stop_codon:yes gene_type:complete
LFELHPQLVKDTIFVGEFELSKLLIHRDATYPWFILVPKKPDITEIYHLLDAERSQLMSESCLLAEAMMKLFLPDKINIAALGNIVPQLHLHHVARYKTDLSWPNSIWGRSPQTEYRGNELQVRIKAMMLALYGNSSSFS